MKARDRENASGSMMDWIAQIAITVLGVAGIGISGYLTLIHYQNLNSICLFGVDCDAVLTSEYAQMWGVPLALFGVFMYAVLTVLGLLSLLTKGGRQDLIALGTYAVALSGILFTGYLYYLEIFVIHAFCSWCIASSIVLFGIFVLSLVNLSASGLRFKEIPRSMRIGIRRYVQW